MDFRIMPLEHNFQNYIKELNDNSCTTLEIKKVRESQHSNLLNLAATLRSNTSLKKLSLSDIKFSDDAFVVTVAISLRSNTTLKELSLVNLNISNAAAIYLARALEENKTLIILDLAENHITLEGAVALANLLQKNNTLKTLNLRSNFITSNGAAALANALKVNTTLGELIIPSDYQAAFKKITLCLERNNKTNNETVNHEKQKETISSLEKNQYLNKFPILGHSSSTKRKLDEDKPSKKTETTCARCVLI